MNADDPDGVTPDSWAVGGRLPPRLSACWAEAPRHRHEDLLRPPGRARRLPGRERDRPPPLAPWANRLGSRRYEVDGVTVDLSGLDLPTDPQGLPIHGTMTAQPGWEVVARDERSLDARLDYGARPDLLAAPCSRTSSASLPRSTRPGDDGDHDRGHQRPGGPGVARLPPPTCACRASPEPTSTCACPTGSTATSTTAAPAGSRRRRRRRSVPSVTARSTTSTLGDDRRLAVDGRRSSVTVALGDGYPYAQVFAPPGEDVVSSSR